MNAVFAFLIVGSVVMAVFTGRMPEVMQAGIDSAKSAVGVAFGLIGMMALWLGFMRVLRDAGALAGLARLLAPLMRRVFPDVPPDHPAMSAMLMNMAANMLGLGNAATPFGLKAMQELERLNPHRGIATNSMALFLAINTSGVAVLPLGVIALRASVGSENAGGIFIPTVLATLCSTLVAFSVAKLLQSRASFSVERALGAEGGPKESAESAIRGLDEAEEIAGVRGQPAGSRMLLLAAFALFVITALGLHVARAPDPLAAWREVGTSWLLPVLMCVIVLFGVGHRVKVYESLVAGAREGFDIFVMIVPFLVAILVAIGMFRASGALDWAIATLAPATALIGFPAEALPMALLKPLSGGGALGVLTETLQAHGPDSFVGFLVSTMSGSTETTFYVIAVYFGSVQVRAVRHTLAACLAADVTGFLAALFWCRLFF